MMRSGLSSNRGMQQSGTPDVGSGGTGSLTGIPGSRNGLGTPVMTVAISPNPSVGATDVSDAACTASPRSARVGRSVQPDRESAAVSTTAAGSGRAVAVTVTSPGSELSTWVKLKNSLTVPRAVTWLPTATAGVAAVNTKMPSDVAGLASASASGACRKKPFDLIPVTRPVVTTSDPANGETAPLPWMSWMAAATGVQLRVGVAELRGSGLPIAKSTLLLSESKQPPRLRMAAVVLRRGSRRATAFETRGAAP